MNNSKCKNMFKHKISLGKVYMSEALEFSVDTIGDRTIIDFCSSGPDCLPDMRRAIDAIKTLREIEMAKRRKALPQSKYENISTEQLVDIVAEAIERLCVSSPKAKMSPAAFQEGLIGEHKVSAQRFGKAMGQYMKDKQKNIFGIDREISGVGRTYCNVAFKARSGEISSS